MDIDQSPSETILLGVGHQRNYEQLVEHLSTTYDLLDGPDPNAVDQPFDLWIVDAPTLEQHHNQVQTLKSQHDPLFLPVILLFPEDRVSTLKPSIWDTVDAIISVPITPAILQATIENLLQTRTLSQSALNSKQQFESLVQTTSSAVIFLSPEGTIEQVNNATESLFGYESDELLGEPITRLIPARLQDAAAGGIEAYRTRIDPGVSGGALESTGQHKDGHEIPIQLSYGWFELDGDVFLTGIINDTTEIKERETRLQVLNRVLRHDVRNDMNLIKGHAEMLSEEFDEPNPQLETILSVADEVVELSAKARELDQLLNRGQVGSKEIDICALVEAKCLQFRDAYPEATIETAFPTGREFRAEAIPLVESAIDNVIENAIEHNDTEHPEVSVTVSIVQRDGNDVVSIEIADNGPGLPPQDIEVIETNTESALEHASGLGLWLVNWIITESDGHIQLTENDPRGSCITILLPLARKSETV